VSFFGRICTSGRRQRLRRPEALAEAMISGKSAPVGLKIAPGGRMIEREPNIVSSGLSRAITRDGVTVEVAIVRLEHEKLWSLEVVNSAQTSIVWDDLFATDEEAYAEFERTVAEEGMQTFLDTGKVIPFPR
jgi:hypothetical protein